MGIGVRVSVIPSPLLPRSSSEGWKGVLKALNGLGKSLRGPLEIFAVIMTQSKSGTFNRVAIFFLSLFLYLLSYKRQEC